MEFPSIGQSLEAAVVCSVFFGAAAVITLTIWIRSKTFPFSIMGLSSVVRFIGMVIRSASITQGSANTGMYTAHFLLSSAGFNMALDMHCVTLASWFGNTDPSLLPPLGQFLIKFTAILPPISVAFGPLMGIPTAVMMYKDMDNPGQAWENLIVVRKVIVTGNLVMSCLTTALALYAWVWTVTYHREIAPAKHIHQKIWLLILSGVLLTWGTAVRVYTTYTDLWFILYEERFFPAQELPELLQLLMWCWPYIMVDVVHSSKTTQHWDAISASKCKAPHKVTSFMDIAAAQPSTDSSEKEVDAMELGKRQSKVQGEVTLDMPSQTLDVTGRPNDAISGTHAVGELGPKQLTQTVKALVVVVNAT